MKVKKRSDRSGMISEYHISAMRYTACPLTHDLTWLPGLNCWWAVQLYPTCQSWRQSCYRHETFWLISFTATGDFIILCLPPARLIDSILSLKTNQITSWSIGRATFSSRRIIALTSVNCIWRKIHRADFCTISPRSDHSQSGQTRLFAIVKATKTQKINSGKD